MFYNRVRPTQYVLELIPLFNKLDACKIYPVYFIGFNIYYSIHFYIFFLSRMLIFSLIGFTTLLFFLHIFLFLISKLTINMHVLNIGHRWYINIQLYFFLLLSYFPFLLLLTVPLSNLLQLRSVYIRLTSS